MDTGLFPPLGSCEYAAVNMAMNKYLLESLLSILWVRVLKHKSKVSLKVVSDESPFSTQGWTCRRKVSFTHHLILDSNIPTLVTCNIIFHFEI